jgi:signal transduction histidine kinase
MVAALKSRLGDPPWEDLGPIADTVERMDGMLANLREFLRVQEGGAIDLARRPLDLQLICERVIDTIQHTRPYHGIEFLRGPRLDGQWDPEKVEALLWKLVLNAIEHGERRRGARIRLTATPRSAVLEVWNAGPAMSKALLRRAFDPFVCGPPRDGQPQGLGLGLYLAREIVRAHGGQIEGTSSPQSGTTLRVTLPRA